MSGEPVIGIDLGTAYSAAAYVNADGKAQMLPNAEGQNLTPSAVYCDEGSLIVGQPAIDAGLSDPSRLAQFFKRQMAKDSWAFAVNARTFSAIDLSTQVLRKLKTDAEQALGQSVTRAVVTVPAYFGEPERRATMAAAESAGLDVLRLINEPTAAAVAYGLDSLQQPGTMLFYDLGGGTFDITACRMDKHEIHVLASEGHVELGGKDFDDLILQLVSDKFHAAHGLDPRSDVVTSGELRERVIRAKHLLTSKEQAQILVVAYGKRLSVEITRSEFENVSKRLMRHSQVLVNSVLEQSGLGLNDIDKVVLVGGSSRMPMVKRTLSGYFSCPVMLAANPDEAVALGAAVIANRAAQENNGGGYGASPNIVGGIAILDVISHSIGVQAKSATTGRQMNRIVIPKNTRIPYEAKYLFTIDRDDATSLRVVVCQGEYERLEDCTLLGEFILSELPPGRPRGTPIEVYVKCNENGLIEIRAVDPQTGRSAKINVNYFKSDGKRT